MKIKTDIDDAKKIGNVVEFAEGDLTYQYLAYRKDIEITPKNHIDGNNVGKQEGKCQAMGV